MADVIVSSMIPYLPEDVSARGYGAMIEEGVNGAPDEIVMGMIIRLVDDEDPSLTVLSEVTGNVSNDDASISDTKFMVTIYSR